MKRTNLLPVVALALCWLTTTAGDWPSYLHDAQHTGASPDETILSAANVSQLTKLWSFKTGGVVAASASVVGGTVYVGSWDGNEYALDAATGVQKWKTFLGVTTGDPTCFPSTTGVTSAAAVQNGVVYVGGGDSYWYALDATTGAILWKVFTGDNSAASGHYNWSSPLLYNGFAYIGVASLGDCPLVQGQLLQVSLTTQQVVNTLNIVPTGQVGGGIWTSPSVDPATNTIYVTTGTITDPSQSLADAIVSLDATTLAVKGSWNIANSDDWGTSPTLFNDAAGHPLVGATNKNGIAYAFNRSNPGAGPVWQKQLAFGGGCPTCGDGSVSSGAVGNGTLFLAGGNTTINGAGFLGSVRALDPATGNFLWQHGAPGIVVPALAYANGFIIDGAGSTLEVLDAATGNRLYNYATSAPIFGAPSVSNGEIFVGSSDSNLYAFGLPSTPPPSPVPDPNCPAGWSCQDIGNPALAGSESASGGSWSVTAGGTGVGGTADQFRLISQTVAGDSQIRAQVVSQQATTDPAQAGLMVRQRADPGSPYFAVSFSAGRGLVVHYRSTFNGGTATATVPMSLPVFIEIQRRGDQFLAATSTDGVSYTLVPGSTVTLTMPTAVLEGVSTSSANAGTTNTAAYSGVAVGVPSAAPAFPPTASPCPPSWSCADVGNPGLVGNQMVSGGTWTVTGAGVDIWGTFDQFHYVWQPLAGDGTVSARVVSQSNTDQWAKAGVMLRQSTDSASPYYAALVTPGNGIVVQYRQIQGLNAKTIVATTGVTPAFLEVARSGSAFTAYTSNDGISWIAVPGSTLTLSLTNPVLGGLAVTSHSASQSSVTFDTVGTSGSAVPPPTACPGGWNCADIGNPSPIGGQSLSNGTWTVMGAGADIWGPFDQFHYVWQQLAGDGTLGARVVSQSNTNSWAKAGLMLRQSTDPGSPYYAALVTPGNGIVVQDRVSQGSIAAQVASVAGTVPAFLRVGRAGNAFTAYTSFDGATWTAIPGSTVTLALSSPVLGGLAVASHSAGAATVTFDNVNLAGVTTPPAFRSSSTVANAATVGAPSPIAQGDLLVATVEADQDPVTVTGPAGWTQLLDTPTAAGTASAFHAQVWFKVAGASEPGSYSWSVPSGVYTSIGVLDYTNVDTTAPIDGASGRDAGTTATPTTASLTTTRANDMIVAAFINYNNVSWTAGSGMTQRDNFDGNTAQDALQASAGSTGSKTATASGIGPAAALIVALKARADSPLPAITNVQVSAVTTTGATISWTTDVPASSQVDFGPSSTYGSSTPLDSTLTTSHSQTLSGLSPATPCHYRVKSTNANGVQGQSVDSTFTTATPAAPVITNVQSSNVTSSGATITWTTDTPSDTTVQYGTTTGYGSTVSTPGSVTTHSQALSALSQSTTYHYQVQSKDAYNQVSTRADFTFTTGGPPPTITNVTAGAMTTTGATITWTTDVAATSQVNYGISTGYGSSTTLDQNLVTNHSQGLSGLSPATTYHYQVKSVNASGSAAVSADFTFVTLSAPPTFRSRSTKVNGTTVSKPTGVAAGDLLLAQLEVDADPVTVTGQTGWALLLDTSAAQGTSSAYHAQVWYKVATASEPTSYTWTVSGTPWVDIGLLDYTNVNTSTPIDASNGIYAGTTRTPSTSAITTTAANDLVVAVFINFNTATWTAGSGMSKRLDSDGSEVQDAPQAAPGSTGTKTATASIAGPITAQIVALHAK